MEYEKGWNVDEDMVRYVAEVAKLKLSDEEVKKFKEDLEEILESFKKIAEVDVKDVEPTFQPIEVKNVFREDVVKESVGRDVGLSNTKNVEDGYFKGPKAIE